MARKSKKAKPGPRKGKGAPKGKLVAKHSGIGKPKEEAKPKKKKRKKYGFYKFVSTETDVAAAISDAFGAIQELRDEMQEQVGNMDGTPAEHTPKYEVVTNAAEELDQVADNEPSSYSDEVGAIKVTVTESVPRRAGKGTGRAVRLSNATGALQACIEALNNVPDEDPLHEDAADLANELDEAANLDVSEWPSMYG